MRSGLSNTVFEIPIIVKIITKKMLTIIIIIVACRKRRAHT